MMCSKRTNVYIFAPHSLKEKLMAFSPGGVDYPSCGVAKCGRHLNLA